VGTRRYILGKVLQALLTPALVMVFNFFMGTSTIASAAIGLLIGIHSGWRRGSRFDVGSQGFTLFVYWMPELVRDPGADGVRRRGRSVPLALPGRGVLDPGADLTGFAHVADVLNHLALPWFVLTIAFMGEYALIMRNSLIDVIDDYFVTTARVKGIREKEILWRQLEPATRRAELLTV
jgi:peptide/nickel transport system permease protein